jgi:hypothetical protein
VSPQPGNWQLPRQSRYGGWQVNRTRVADRQWRVGVNRILGHPIGVYVIAGWWLYGICRPIRGEQRRRKQAEGLR